MRKMRFLNRLKDLEVCSKIPLIEIAGHSRVLVENHVGVLAYSSEEIVVKVQFGCVQVVGQKLMFAEICREQLVITGEIVGITIHRR